jgi:hypothetical protein
MKWNYMLCTLLTAIAVFCTVDFASAQTPAAGPPQAGSAPAASHGEVKMVMEPSMIVMNAHGATLLGQTLTLTGVSADSIVFADRPVRAAGHLLTTDVLQEWASDGSFAKDPPNATVSALSSDGNSAQDAVVELSNPRVAGDKLSFDVRVLEGGLSNANGPAAVFIDIIGMPLTPLSYAGVARRTARRAYWYGAAAAPYARPYAYPPYGYPPYGYPPYGYPPP